MLIRRIKVAGLLPFGPEGIDLPLQPLNVLIGPNGSGKSNLLEVLGLLRASPGDLPAPIKTMGGVEEWLWKAPTVTGLTSAVNAATIDVVVEPPSPEQMPIRHVLEFMRHGDRFEVADERIESERPHRDYEGTYFFYRFRHGEPVINERGLRRESVKPETSILSQVKDPERYPVLGWLQEQYERIRLYRGWPSGPSTALRRLQSSDGRNDVLDDGADNLILVLSNILPRIESCFVDALRQLYEGVDGIYATVRDGNPPLSLKESGGRLITAARLSDGTLRYLTLLAILLHPEPPPLVAIEEPELALHPDLLPKLADLLVDASSRCQLLVTTHSDLLVDALSEHLESVVVCEKHDGQTSMRRLDRSDLARWLERYGLGQLWAKGKLGGVRW